MAARESPSIHSSQPPRERGEGNRTGGPGTARAREHRCVRFGISYGCVCMQHPALPGVHGSPTAKMHSSLLSSGPALPNFSTGYEL